MILFWANDVSVVCAFRYGLTRDMFLGERALALIFIIMTDDLPKIVSNWAVLTAYVRGNVELSYLAAASFIAHRHDGFWLLFQQKNNGMLPNSMHYVLIEQKKT